jgi:phage baseplate assembly protein W
MAMINFPRRQSGNANDIVYIRPTAVNKSIGVTYPFNNSNGIFFKSYTNYDQILTNLKMLLLTTTGERYLQPEFGTDLRRILFENISNEEEFKERISGTIPPAIRRWLLYISVVRCDVKLNVDENGDIKDSSNVVKIELVVSISGTPTNLPIRIFISETGQLKIETPIYQQIQSY